jgi:hypothetical protein
MIVTVPALLACAATACAQAPGATLAARLAAAPGSTATFEFPARPGLCGDGRTYIRTGEHTTVGSWTSGDDLRSRPCVEGPVRVLVQHDGAAVSDVHATVGAPAPDAGAANLGPVTAVEATAFLLDVAERGSGRAAERAVFPALLGEAGDVGPRLLRVARAQPGARKGARHEALFWAGRYAAARVRGRDNPLTADDDCEAQDEKRQAVFALSQLRHDEAVPALMEVARTNRDGCVRGAALFWLGESGDARATDVFASILQPR